MVWNILALTLLLGVLGAVVQQTVRSFLMQAVNRELERQVQQVRLPPPSRERPPRPDKPNGPLIAKHLSDQRWRGSINGPHPPGLRLSRVGYTFPVFQFSHYDEFSGSPPHPPHEHAEEEHFPGPPPLDRRSSPPPRESGPYRPHHFDLYGESIVPFDERPLWDAAGFAQAKRGRKHFSTIEFNGESLHVLSEPVRERDMVVAVVQMAYPLADVQLAIAGLDRALLTLIPLGLLFAGLGGSYLTTRVLRRVHLATQAARDITGGDFSTRLPVSGQDEFSDLADTFNNLLNRLQHAFEQQQHLLEQQRRFTADASHKLKTPLTVIKGTASLMLQSQPTAAGYWSAFHNIDHATETMSQLVQDLLLLARADGGQLGKDPIELLVRDMLDSAILGVAPTGAAITVQIPDETLTVMGNERELVRLVSNVLKNATQHTPSEGTITITTRAAGEYIRISIQDTGPGIAPEHLLHLGERFYRVDAARAEGGTGLGLSICREIVEAHRGAMQIESTLGVGTTVRIELPRAH